MSRSYPGTVTIRITERAAVGYRPVAGGQVLLVDQDNVAFRSVSTTPARDGRTVLWGGVDRSSDKARLLSVLLPQPGRYFDLSDPSTVISRTDPGN